MNLTNRTKIALIAFLILFLELCLIRFLPAQIACLAYYSNFILLASFVGIGFGILLAGKKIELVSYFPWALLLLIILCTKLTLSISIMEKDELHFYSPPPGYLLPEKILIPIIFIATAIVFALLSQRLGKLFSITPPLEAYTYDIIGSLVGVASFTACSFFSSTPLVWFLIFAVVFLFIYREERNLFYRSLIAFFILIIVINTAIKDTYWSPYQKITVYPWIIKNELAGHHILTNNIHHQSVVKDLALKEWFYKVPYEVFNANNYNNVLIIGSGTGNDVALALKEGVKHIDAVEIDPTIYDLGVKLNPNKPFKDPRVSIYITDGRSFLNKTDKKYDLIIYALTDSLRLASSHSNIRLESFLFTLDSFKAAKEHLTEDGIIALYNYYREGWLIEKFSSMLKKVFNRETFVYRSQGNSAILMNGPRLNKLRVPMPPIVSNEIIESSTDDWPFPYLNKRTLPPSYVYMLALIVVIVSVSFYTILGKPLYEIIQPSYFFLGMAFLLLETKSIILFSLFFGATWIVNALVFFAILLLVLLSIYFVKAIKINNIKIFYIALFICIAIQYFFPMQTLLLLPPFLRYAAVSLFTLSPVFIGNIIFSETFKSSSNNTVNFASNILGAAMGGIVEYLALISGYKNLALVILVFYMLAFNSSFKKIATQ